LAIAVTLVSGAWFEGHGLCVSCGKTLQIL